MLAAWQAYAAVSRSPNQASSLSWIVLWSVHHKWGHHCPALRQRRQLGCCSGYHQCIYIIESVEKYHKLSTVYPNNSHLKYYCFGNHHSAADSLSCLLWQLINLRFDKKLCPQWPTGPALFAYLHQQAWYERSLWPGQSAQSGSVTFMDATVVVSWLWGHREDNCLHTCLLRMYLPFVARLVHSAQQSLPHAKSQQRLMIITS